MTRTEADRRRARIDRLLDRLLDLPPAERAAALDTLPDEDVELRAELAHLLALVDAAAPALEPGYFSDHLRLLALDAIEHESAALAPGECIGRWRVLREIGRGGMGTVYLVERADGHFEQRGALKLVRGRGAAGLTHRFHKERQILASLDHAGVARLLDGGETEDGQPYFVMEHVDGVAIDRHADAAQLAIEDRLEIFVRVAAVIQHAHQRLIVHHDIKPSNIIITADGSVKLLDFGIAQILSSDEAPEAGDEGRGAIVLTPDYASPEHVRSERPATASDIYQLGLLLYELLTGRRAQEVRDARPRTLEEVVCRQPIVKPSVCVAREPARASAEARRKTPRGLARRLRGDLDAIVLRAIEKDPERRYATAGDLIADVQRHRAGRPVDAMGPAFAYRARKFARRHRAALASAAAALTTLAWVVPQLGYERQRTARASARAEQVERVLANVFALPPGGSSEPPTARNYVDQAARLVRRDLGNQPASQANLLEHFGAIYILLGLYAPANDVIQQSLTIRRARFGEDSAEVADSLMRLAQSEHYLGRYDSAEANMRRALEIRRVRFGATDPSAIFSSLDLADLLHTRGELIEAESVLRASRRLLLRDVHEPNLLARTTRDLANVLRDRGALDESESLYRQAMRMLIELRGDEDADLAATRLYFARLLITKGELDEAGRLLATGIAVLRSTFHGEHPLTGVGLRNLGYLQIVEGRYDEADATLDRSERILIAWLGAEHPIVPRTRAHQADLAWRRGRPAEAADIAERTVRQFARLGLRAHPSAIDACLTLGRALLRLGRQNEAAAALTPCATDAERLFVAGDARTAALRAALARARPSGTTSP